MDVANATTQADVNQSTALRSASVYIFLAVTCLLVIQALALSFATMRTLGKLPYYGSEMHPLMPSLATKTGTDRPPAYSQIPNNIGSVRSRISGMYGIFILLIISALLLAREAFYSATAHHLNQVSIVSSTRCASGADVSMQQTNEHLWYPLSAMTEFIAVVLFAVPGLVPAQEELPQETREMSLLS